MTSDKVDLLEPAEEVFYRRLMSKVDDHGLFDARPSILRASLFPLRLDRVREADISRWMAACQKAGLIVLYEADGKQLLCLLNTGWDKRSNPKYPLPPANSCKQPLTNPNTSTVVVVVDEVDIREKSFGEFWKSYPRKVAKPSAKKAWKKINIDADFEPLMAGLAFANSCEQWLRDGGKFIPHPATWLNDRRWEDEVAAPSASPFAGAV